MKTGAPLGIIAAAGKLPRLAAEAVSANGRPVFVIALKDIATADFSAYPSATLRIGGFKAIVDTLKDAGCREVMLAGKLARPRMTDAMPDAMASKVALTLMTSGDDAALRKIRDILADAGIDLADPGQVFSRMKSPAGVLAGSKPDADIIGQIDYGKTVLSRLGDMDVGQAVIIQGRRVLALEAAEGTDAMISRTQALIDPDLGPVVMVKMMKPGQDRALDPPVLGAETVKNAIDAGITVLAVEAESVIMVDRDEAVQIAQNGGVTLIGVEG